MTSPAAPTPPSSEPGGPARMDPLLENVEGMALGGKRLTDGEHKGRLPLYLVSDNNESADQRTRVYALSVRLPQ